MPGQKLLCAHASAAFALERENPERLLAAGDDDAVPARFYDLAWRTGTPIGHFCLPDLQQARFHRLRAGWVQSKRPSSLLILRA